MDQEMISVGEICGTYGYRGELKVIPLTDFPERFAKMSEVWVDKNGKMRLLHIDSVKPYKQFYLFKFKGLDSKEEAALLFHGHLKVEEKDLSPLPDGSYYIFQLIGLEVVDEERGSLGKLVDVLQTGANDVYVVQGQSYGEVLIPAIKDVILGVDMDQKRMQVKLLPGLLD